MSKVHISRTSKSFGAEYREKDATASVQDVKELLDLTEFAVRCKGKLVEPVVVAEVKKVYDFCEDGLVKETIHYLRKRIGGIQFDMRGNLVTILFSDEDHKRVWYMQNREGVQSKRKAWATTFDIPTDFDPEFRCLNT